MPQQESLGFIGLGAMGAPMVRRLLGLGHALVVFDINPQALQAAREAGARIADSPRHLASEATTVFTCLPSLDALRRAVLGEDGVCQGVRVGIVVDFSTTGSEFAGELAAGLAPRGIRFLDSPITGSVVTAGNGQLGIMCSGPRSAFEQVEPVMHQLAGAIVLHLGETNGRAQTLKLLNNLLSATGMAATCEAFLLGAKAGLDPWRMLEVINAGDASSSASRNKFSKAVLPRRFDYGARMAITAKDTSLTVAEAEALGVPMWVGQAVRQVWNVAASLGGASRDGSSLITYLEPWAGIELPASEGPAAAVPEAAPPAAAQPVLMVCEAAAREALVAQLAACAAPASAAGAAAAACTVVGVAPDAGIEQWMAALPPRAATPGVIVNLCPMPAAAAEALAAAARQAGAGYVEALLAAPLRSLGSADALFIVAGLRSDRAAAASALQGLGGRCIAISERAGDAQRMHQIHEAVFATLLAATCEAFVTGAKAGLEPLTMTRIMGVETGRNAASARIVPQEVATRRFEHGRSLGALHRALECVGDAARGLGLTPWILDRTRLLFGLAVRLGSAHDDASRLVTHYEKWAGTEVRAHPAPSAGPETGEKP